MRQVCDKYAISMRQVCHMYEEVGVVDRVGVVEVMMCGGGGGGRWRVEEVVGLTGGGGGGWWVECASK